MLYTELAVVIGLVELFTPFIVASIYSALERVGEDLIMAARTLGAGSIHVFKDVILPLSAKGYFFGLTIVIAGSFTAYTTPVLLGGTKNMTLSMLLYLYAATLLDWNSAVGLSILMLVIVVGLAALPRIILRKRG
ncbi:MAG TPA: ABC transporter permease subunit [Fervidicoccus fontis]|uniref:ABC transporter permease subunit n=1 Tax=Fervidicoccus fontis TaxID=683846 RepID=A0A7C2UTM0_9CREN|nr:ABC transporter permease subunit [Fervidicoccus fontis]